MKYYYFCPNFETISNYNNNNKSYFKFRDLNVSQEKLVLTVPGGRAKKQENGV